MEYLGIAVGVFGLIGAAFALLDRWHQRYAWRKATKIAAQRLGKKTTDADFAKKYER